TPRSRHRCREEVSGCPSVGEDRYRAYVPPSRRKLMLLSESSGYGVWQAKKESFTRWRGAHALAGARPSALAGYERWYGCAPFVTVRKHTCAPRIAALADQFLE